ncbi:MAG: MFS transporter [Desulfobacterales bacterium]|nr:MFS transporter [Desulfobacterales bacterium]
MTPFKILCGVGLLAVLSSTISKNPALPLLVTHLEGNQMAVGFVAGISAFTGILFSFPAGFLSDRIGRRRMLLISGGVFATAPFLYLLASEVWHIGVIRFYHGLATAIFGPVAMAHVADLHQESRGEKMGWFSTATLLGRFSAPALGGFVLALSASGQDLSFTGVYLVCGLAGVGALAAMFLLPRPREIAPRRGPGKTDWKEGIGQLLASPAIMATCAVEAAILFAYGIFETFLPLRGINQGLTTWEIGICISSQIITIAISKPMLGRFSDRHGRPPQIIWGSVFAGISMVALAYSFSFVPLLGASIFLGLSVSVVTSASAAYIADLSSGGQYGSAMGMLGSIMDIGHTTGPMVGGILAVSLGLTTTFLSGCLVLLLAGVCFLYFHWKHRTTTPPAIKSDSAP